MIVVIQCAATKRPEAGYFRSTSGARVLFVANPVLAPRSEGIIHAHPDEPAEDGQPWRRHLIEYNKRAENPFGLFQAISLYAHPAYDILAGRFALDRVFILSAGWGLIGGRFRVPQYDITLSSAVRTDAPWKLRRKRDQYGDLSQLPDEFSGRIVFLGGKDYIPLFCALTNRSVGERVVYYNSATRPMAPGCTLERFDTTTRTNWHYECASWLASTS